MDEIIKAQIAQKEALVTEVLRIIHQGIFHYQNLLVFAVEEKISVEHLKKITASVQENNKLLKNPEAVFLRLSDIIQLLEKEENRQTDEQVKNFIIQFKSNVKLLN
ncbi:MAG: hypothetical protein AAGI07_00305 [Bacteroidota bacterium]